MVEITILVIAAACAGVPTFEAPVDITFPNRQFPTQPALADFDHDGRMDLLVPGRNQAGLVYLLRGVAGGFATPEPIAVGCQTDWAAAADLDGDGLIDVALAARASIGGVVILRNHGDGTFEQPQRIFLERETRCVQIADFDHDGRPDLLLANYGSGGLMILHNDGAMHFTPISSARLNRWTVGSALASVVFCADINSDGQPAIIDFAGGSGRIDIRAISQVRIGDEYAWSLPVEASSVVGVALGTMADLNGDGIPELIAPVINSDRSNPIYVWSISSDSHALSSKRFPGLVSGTAWSAATADLDGDGDQDVICMSVNNGCVSILENKTAPGGPIVLAEPIPILTSNFARHVVPVDFDGDGRIDLVVSDFLDHRMRLLRNTGIVTFTPPMPRMAIMSLPDSTVVTAAPHVFETEGVASNTNEAEALLAYGPAMQPLPQPPSTTEIATVELVSVCGALAGDCDKVHAGPGCFTPLCCDTVCGFKPECCTVTWDAECVAFASSECRGMICPSRGDCATAHGGPGCESAECCERVRRLDPNCSYVWDQLCVELVPLVCDSAAPVVIAPVDALDESEHCYESHNEGCGKRSDPAHTPLLTGLRYKGTITADGVRDVDAYLLQVSQRQHIHLALHADFPAQLVISQGACDGPLHTLDESLAAPGGFTSIDRILEVGEYRITISMAVATRTLRNGQPCQEVNPATGATDPPPVPGFFNGIWWLQVDAAAAPVFGDIDGNGIVDFGDVVLLLLGFGESDPALDVDGSGEVDFGDVVLVLMSFSG